MLFRSEDAWPCHGTVTVSADGLRTVAPYLAEDAVVEEVDAGRHRITLGSWSWAGLAAVVAGLPVEVTVEGPPPLRDAVLALADKLRTALG